MEDLANEFSSYAMIEDIGSAPCGISSTKKQSSDDQQSNSKKHNFTYKSKLNYSVNLNLNSSPGLMSSPISKNVPKSTKHRYSTRSSSMLLKSNSLALSDSESTFSDDSKEKETSFFNKKKQKPKKPRRKKPEKEPQIYPCVPISTNFNNKDQYYGKRKRSTTISQSSYEQNSQMSAYTTNKLKKNEFSNLSLQYDFDDKNKLSKYQTNEMEIEEQEDSSSLSEESNSLSDPRFADDEQSDFELTRTLRAQNRKYGRTSLEKSSFGSIVNPFSMLSSSPSTSSNFLWKVKKRRKNMNLPLNLPNNHFN